MHECKKKNKTAKTCLQIRDKNRTKIHNALSAVPGSAGSVITGRKHACVQVISGHFENCGPFVWSCVATLLVAALLCSITAITGPANNPNKILPAEFSAVNTLVGNRENKWIKIRRKNRLAWLMAASCPQVWETNLSDGCQLDPNV